MADQPATETTQEEATEQTQVEQPVINDGFEQSFQALEPEQTNSGDDAKDETQTTTEETETETKEDNKTEEEAKPVEVSENLAKLLDTQFKRHDTVKPLKDWISENPEIMEEVLGQTIDWSIGKAQAKKLENDTKSYLLKETEKLQQEKSILDTIVMQNIAYEVDAPIKTLQDFENDLNIDEPEKAFEDYQTAFRSKAKAVAEARAYANMRNDKMFEDFAKTYPDVDLSELATGMQGYLDYSVSKGQKPLPEDTALIYYRGKNFDKLVKEAVGKAVIDAKATVLKEIEANSKNNKPVLASERSKQVDYDPNDPFENSFKVIQQAQLH